MVSTNDERSTWISGSHPPPSPPPHASGRTNGHPRELDGHQGLLGLHCPALPPYSREIVADLAMGA